jgi:hypothetical protein
MNEDDLYTLLKLKVEDININILRLESLKYGMPASIIFYKTKEELLYFLIIKISLI